MQRQAHGLALAMALGLLFTTTAGAVDLVPDVRLGTTGKGEVLTDVRGMTLYVFDKDGAGTSACYGACARNWPPLQPSPGAVPAGDFTIITRDDGLRQWAYRGRPLYGWIKDEKPGDTSGDGFRDVWHLARP